MWERSELKEKGKASLKANYWKTVLVAIVATFVIGSGVGGAGSASGVVVGSIVTLGGMAPVTRTDVNQGLVDRVEANRLDEGDVDGGGDGRAAASAEEGATSTPVAEHRDSPESADPAEIAAVALSIALLVCLVMLVTVAMLIAVDILILGPLQVGVSRFFLRNLNQRAEVGECGRGFDRNYVQNLKTMFFRELYTCLWSLLFVIPGIVKSYEYRMIPYLLAEDPNMTREEAFAQSRALMDGNKWDAFVLDLSFIGWDLLSLLTLGLLDVLYVAPYRQMTYAALYEALRYGSDSRVLPQASIPGAPMASEGGEAPSDGAQQD